MSKTWVTRCPQCQTAFRLTRAQLQAANGSVRCGSCLHVFKATNHIIAQPDASAAGQPTPAPTPKPAPAPTQRPAAAPPRPAPPPPEPKRQEFELSDDFTNLEAWSPEQTGTYTGDRDHVGHEAADESWAMDMLEELEKEQKAPPPAPAAPPKQKPLAESNEWGLDGEPDFSDTDLSTFDEINKLEAAENKKAPDQNEMGGLRADKRALHALNDEPLNLHLPDRPARWKTVLTTMACLLAAAALALQYAWYDRNQLARLDTLRPYYQVACERFGCALPDKINIAAIRGTNLVVRSHPKFENALVVDAIISNLANYSQPFPAIQLSFSDLTGQPVASRRFTPAEYLAGELAGAREMPSRTPIHLALEIVDPGQKAVNYRLAFYPAP
ncbi:DUF3426 domain-containing protein [Aestuariirhabdus sp. LZHN29]|uniref:DUF3426 domain-containing protein n=1 Tax=Aestuariirhabdus sp. LZHN29 TaxID=3417462 RepID=UPI003CECDC76